MTPQESANAAVARVKDRINTIAARSDVKYTLWSRMQYDTKKWKGCVPEDFWLFYDTLGGLHFHWEFTDDPHHMHHGPRWHALHPNGRNTVDPPSRLVGEARSKAQACEFLGDEVRSWGDDSVVIFSGQSGEGGLLLRQTGDDTFAFYGFDSDGDVCFISDTFTGFLDRALPSGFAANWDRDGDSATRAAKQLATEVPPRKLVSAEVTDRQTVSGASHRRELAEAVTKGKFDALMKSLGRPERAKKLDDEGRIAVLLDAFETANKWSAATCKVGAPLVRSWNKSTRKAVVAALDVPDQVRLTFVVRKHETRGAPKVAYAQGVLSTIVEDALGLKAHTYQREGPDFKKGEAEIVCTFGALEGVNDLVVGWTHTLARVWTI